MNTKRIQYNFIKCGLTGWCLEIFWTGLGSLINADLTMTGRSSLLMFPIYGMAACLRPIHQTIKDRNVLFRGGVYAVLIFAAEYLTGSLLRQFNICPWDYGSVRYSINGLIRLDYTPVWLIAGLIMEKIIETKNLL